MHEQLRRLRVVSEPTPGYKPPQSIKGKATPDQLWRAFKSYFECQVQETIIVVALDPEWRILGYSEIARGKRHEVPMPVSTILQFALLTNANDLVIMHGHNGCEAPEASRCDVDATAQLAGACALVEIRFLDHIICGRDTFYSFRLKGHL